MKNTTNAARALANTLRAIADDFCFGRITYAQMSEKKVATWQMIDSDPATRAAVLSIMLAR